jgi:hypothetical protein
MKIKNKSVDVFFNFSNINKNNKKQHVGRGFIVRPKQFA